MRKRRVGAGSDVRTAELSGGSRGEGTWSGRSVDKLLKYGTWGEKKGKNSSVEYNVRGWGTNNRQLGWGKNEMTGPGKEKKWRCRNELAGFSTWQGKKTLGWREAIGDTKRTFESSSQSQTGCQVRGGWRT